MRSRRWGRKLRERSSITRRFDASQRVCSHLSFDEDASGRNTLSNVAGQVQAAFCVDQLDRGRFPFKKSRFPAPRCRRLGARRVLQPERVVPMFETARNRDRTTGGQVAKIDRSGIGDPGLNRRHWRHDGFGDVELCRVWRRFDGRCCRRDCFRRWGARRLWPGLDCWLWSGGRRHIDPRNSHQTCRRRGRSELDICASSSGDGRWRRWTRRDHRHGHNDAKGAYADCLRTDGP